MHGVRLDLQPRATPTARIGDGIMHLLLAAFLLATAAQTEKDVQHPITGVFKGDIKDPVKKDVIMKVAMQAPSKLPERRTLGLIVLHHGFNGNENNYFGGAV